MYLKLGEMYVYCVSIETYEDNEITIKFTNNIDNATLYPEIKVQSYKRIIESCLQCSLTEEKAKESE